MEPLGSAGSVPHGFFTRSDNLPSEFLAPEDPISVVSHHDKLDPENVVGGPERPGLLLRLRPCILESGDTWD